MRTRTLVDFMDEQPNETDDNDTMDFMAITELYGNGRNMVQQSTLAGYSQIYYT